MEMRGKQSLLHKTDSKLEIGTAVPLQLGTYNSPTYRGLKRSVFDLKGPKARDYRNYDISSRWSK